MKTTIKKNGFKIVGRMIDVLFYTALYSSETTKTFCDKYETIGNVIIHKK